MSLAQGCVNRLGNGSLMEGVQLGGASLTHMCLYTHEGTHVIYTSFKLLAREL